VEINRGALSLLCAQFYIKNELFLCECARAAPQEKVLCGNNGIIGLEMCSIKFPYYARGVLFGRKSTSHCCMEHIWLGIYFKLLLWSRAGSEIIFYHYSNSELPLSLVHDQSD
jgi:hypothetical protein